MIGGTEAERTAWRALSLLDEVYPTEARPGCFELNSHEYTSLFKARAQVAFALLGLSDEGLDDDVRILCGIIRNILKEHEPEEHWIFDRVLVLFPLKLSGLTPGQ